MRSRLGVCPGAESRQLLTFEAEAEDVKSDDVIAKVLEHVEVP